MQKFGKEMYGKLGECIKMIFTPQWIKNACGADIAIGTYTKQEFERITNASVTSNIPIEIANDIEGNYEAVCENGIEVY